MYPIMNLIIAVLFINAVLGLLAMEWTWRSLKRIRDPNCELAKKYYAFRRMDI